MAQPKWYEGDAEGSNFSDQTTGGGGGGAFNNDSTSDTLEAGNDILKTTNNNSNKNGGDPSTSGANAPQASGDQEDPWITEVRNMAKGKSEDFERFDAGTLMRWKPFYDAEASARAGRPQFRSSRGAEGFYDKPTECPDGQGPQGPDESSPCGANGYGGGAGGSGGGGGGSSSASAPAASVQARPDYKPDTNYLTQRQVGQNYGPGANPSPSTQTAPDASAAPPKGTPLGTQRPDPTAQPREFVLNRDRVNNQPGGTVIPSSVLWKTGM